VSISPIIKCKVGEIDTMILKFLHGVKKHPNVHINVQCTGRFNVIAGVFKMYRVVLVVASSFYFYYAP